MKKTAKSLVIDCTSKTIQIVDIPAEDKPVEKEKMNSRMEGLRGVNVIDMSPGQMKDILIALLEKFGMINDEGVIK